VQYGSLFPDYPKLGDSQFFRALMSNFQAALGPVLEKNCPSVRFLNI